MTEWNPLYLSHIGRVKATYSLSAPDLDPDELTERLGLQPDYSCRRGDPRVDYKGRPLPRDENESVWLISSEGIVSKDINEHLGSLMGRVGARQDFIAELVDSGVKSYFDVLWESRYLYAGTGPVLMQSIVEDMGRLRASIGFDIYQIDSEEQDS